MKLVLLLSMPWLLATCRSLDPSADLAFADRIDASRETLSHGVPVATEMGNEFLVASAFVSRSEVALYYAPRSAAVDSSLSIEGISTIRTIDFVDVPAATRDFTAGESRFADLLRLFPNLDSFVERSSGFDDEEDEAPFAGGTFGPPMLRWDLAFTVGSTDSGETLLVRISTRGSDEGDTRRIWVYLRTPGRDVVRIGVPRRVFRMDKRMTAEIQRFARAITWDGGRYVMVFDRLVDLDSGAETVLVDGVAPDFVDHLVLSPDRTRMVMVYGSYRISKQLVLLPVRWP